MRERDWFMLAALGLLVFTRKRVTWDGSWFWPVPPINVDGRRYNPFISDEWGWRSGGVQHPGVDITFPRRSTSDLVAKYPPGTPQGGRWWFCPPKVPALAAASGTIWSTDTLQTGYRVVVNHGKPFATAYYHLEQLLVPPHKDGELVGGGGPLPVKAGQPLGLIGYSPKDSEKVRHLHFEVWHEGGRDEAVDPTEAMKQWQYASAFNVG